MEKLALGSKESVKSRKRSNGALHVRLLGASRHRRQWEILVSKRPGPSSMKRQSRLCIASVTTSSGRSVGFYLPDSFAMRASRNWEDRHWHD
jgi:hypothetical protein